MFRRSWKMHGRKRSRSLRRSRTPQRTRSPWQNSITRASGAWNQDEFTRTFSEDMPSSPPVVTTDEEADSSLSSACLSPATTPSTVPPQDNSSPTTIYEFHSDCSQSPEETWTHEENGPSRLNPASRVSPAHGFRSVQQHPRYDQVSFAPVSKSSLTTGSINYPTSSINPGGDEVGSQHSSNSWTEAHQIAKPGHDVGWQTYLSLEWPPGVPHPISHTQNQSEHCYSLGVDDTEMRPVYPTTQIEAQPFASLAVSETQSNSVGSTEFPHTSHYGIIRCGSCQDTGATFYTEEGWLAHLQYRHPSWIYRDPNIPKITWYGPALCGACSSPPAMYQNELSWWFHVWMGHPEWLSWIPDSCFCWECTVTAFQNRGDWLAHLWSVHSDWAEWVPRNCMWEDCTSKCRPFKTSRMWLAHVTKTHWKPYRCSIPLCRRPGPFGSQNDLDRHQRQTHQPAVPCAKPNCQATRRGNTVRSDKHEEHDRRWHGPLPCPEPGCKRKTIGGIHHGFSTQDDLEKHLRDKHHVHHHCT
jgi:hypothetical protein